MSSYTNLSSYISVRTLSFICLLLSALLLLSTQGFLIEDLQLVFFIPLLVAFWRLPKNPEHRIPQILVLTVLLLWLGASLQVHGLFNNAGRRSEVYISRFQNDVDGLLRRATYQRYNEIAMTYNLPPMKLLHQTLSMDDKTSAWLKHNLSVPLVVGGDAKHFQISVNGNIAMYERCFAQANAKDTLSPEQYDLARKLGIDLDRDVFAVKLPVISYPLLINLQPLSFELPGDQPELSRHFIAWLAAGFADKPYARFFVSESNADLLSRWQDAFNEALKIDGPWGTPIPAGIAYYLLGTLELLEGLTQAQAQAVLFNTAEATLRKAAGKAHINLDPWLYSAVFNNAAIARIASSNGKKDALVKAKYWLTMALAAAENNSPASLPSRTAVFNLHMLAESGL